MQFDTKCVGVNSDYNSPIYMSNIFSQDDMFYSRYDSPNKRALEKRLQELYDTDKPCSVYNSGMSAISALIHNLIGQDSKTITVLSPSDLYHEARELFRYHKNDIDFRQVDKKRLIENITSEIDIVFLDTISNPLLERYDIKAICDKAHSIGALVAVDNSCLTSYYYNPLKDGVDYVVESLSKGTCGFNDVMAGLLIGFSSTSYTILSGNSISAFPCYLLLRSIPTLAIRMDRITSNALKIVECLKKHTRNVKYGGCGCLITFSFANDNIHQWFIDSLKLIVVGASFGYERTMIKNHSNDFGTVYPKPYHHHIRMSVGIENADDIIADLEQAFKKVGR